jgi:4-hydroxy-2-oxoheptanedioate aldolase
MLQNNTKKPLLRNLKIKANGERSKVKIQDLKKALHEGSRVYGTLITSPSPRWLDVVPDIGLDFVFIDTEHIPVDQTNLYWMCKSYQLAGLPPIVRISSPNPYEATKILDTGAAGIIAPYIEKISEVTALRGAVKKRPLKGEYLDKILSKQAQPTSDLTEYIKKKNKNHILVINIESVPALENFDALLDVPELDAVLIGPHDLSNSLGIPEQYFSEKFENTIFEIINKARTKNIGAGIHVTYPNALEQQVRFAKAGMNMIIHSADILIFKSAMKKEIDFIKKAVGDSVVIDNKIINI